MWGNDLSQRRRLALGIVVLLIVDIIWVLSAELSREIFSHLNFKKPFFVTYFKTAMFTLFLLGFTFMPSWHRLVCRRNRVSPNEPPSRNLSSESLKIDPSELLSEPMFVPTVRTQEEEEEEEEAEEAEEGGDGLRITSINAGFVEQTAAEPEEAAEAAEDVGPLPSNCPHNRGRRQSDLTASAHQRSVRFSDFSEIRHMASSHADGAVRSRMSFNASQVLEREERRNACLVEGRLPITLVIKFAFIFCALWFFGNYSYSMALKDTAAGMVNILSSTSSLFTLILAAVLPSSNAAADRFTVSKLACVCVSIGGIVAVTFGDSKFEQKSVPPGALWALAGALAYALYLVLLRRNVDSDEQMSLPMFFGFVGLFNTVILWPGLFILNATHVETFAMPNSTEWMMLAANGAVGTVLAEVLWLWGCFLTSSLLATLSLSLTTPMTMLTDYIIFRETYSWEVYVGSVPVFLAFVCAAALSHYDNADPLGRWLRLIRSAMVPQWRRVDASVPYTSRRNTGRCVWGEPASTEVTNIERSSPVSFQDLAESGEQGEGLLQRESDSDEEPS